MAAGLAAGPRPQLRAGSGGRLAYGLPAPPQGLGLRLPLSMKPSGNTEDGVPEPGGLCVFWGHGVAIQRLWRPGLLPPCWGRVFNVTHFHLLCTSVTAGCRWELVFPFCGDTGLNKVIRCLCLLSCLTGLWRRLLLLLSGSIPNRHTLQAFTLLGNSPASTSPLIVLVTLHPWAPTGWSGLTC